MTETQEEALRSVPLGMQLRVQGPLIHSTGDKDRACPEGLEILSQEALRTPGRHPATHFTLDLSSHTEALNPCLARTKQPS